MTDVTGLIGELHQLSNMELMYPEKRETLRRAASALSELQGEKARADRLAEKLRVLSRALGEIECDALSAAADTLKQMRDAPNENATAEELWELQGIRRAEEAIREMAAQAPKTCAAQQWQDIATAPKDGTPILIARQDGVWGWIRGWARWAGHKGIEGWISQGFFRPPGELGLAFPTHWMPLPPSPGALAETEGEEK